MASRRRGALAALLLVIALSVALPAAADSGVVCSLCGQTVRGDYTRYEDLGWNVCAECQSGPRCARCNLPRTGRNTGEDDCCARCLAEAERCAACGRPILDRYWTVTGVPGKFCEACRDEAPECSACRAPTRDPRVIDGRVFCPSCRARMVAGPDYEAIYRRVAERARERLGIALRELPPLRVVGPSEIEAMRTTPGHRDDVCGLYVRDEDGDASIQLLSHLPRARATAVVAHELAHAWQAENCPDEQGTRLREGFAEWVAWKVLDGMDGMDAERDLIAARTDEYGLGFRLFAGLERGGGAGHALWYARSARTRP